MSSRGKQTKASRPATTPEARENQLIAKAMAMAERQIDDGTASSQVLTHFLKQASLRETLEREKIMHENALLRAKADAMAQADQREQLFLNALNAFRGYSGQETEELYDD